MSTNLVISTPYIFKNWKEKKFLKLVDTIKTRKDCLVVVNGVFDLLHAGHINLLERARSPKIDMQGQTSFVVAAINSDYSAMYKGPGKPYITFKDRAKILSSIRYVDAVVGFETETPEELFFRLRPDILVKGEEYENQIIEGGQHCGVIVYVKETYKLHTSDIIHKIMLRKINQ